MAAGRPVISTRVGGVQDIMGRKRYSREGFTVWDHGVTVESGDVGSFANALKFMIDRPRLREDMGERGHAFVAAGFSRARLIRDIEELYSDLAGVRPDDVGAVAGESGACVAASGGSARSSF
ncbi:MAG: glycosyltransferase, partial [Blastocatellia bacterium]